MTPVSSELTIMCSLCVYCMERTGTPCACRGRGGRHKAWGVGCKARGWGHVAGRFRAWNVRHGAYGMRHGA